MTIKLHNTLTKKKEEFKPIDPKNVGMYVCGPTVYDRAHIGNARAVVVFDVLYRTLRHEYGAEHVKYVRNITDVDDKINAAAKARNIDISELTKNTTKMFHDDMAAQNCLPPNVEPRATEHIEGMVEMCQTLINNGNAYVAEGHVLFSVATDPKYGHLSHRSRDEMIAGSRVEIAPYKKDPADFVLWKPSAADEPGWPSPWGPGRPGWHIECSVMSTKYLGTTFDIHGGGADLTFPHHENEIAQSCCANPGSEFAKYWVHNGFLTVEGEKMSKSLGNFLTVKDLLDKGVKGEVIRYALLATHYRKPLDWSEKALSDAKKAVYKINDALNQNKNINEVDTDKILISDFLDAIKDDLNTPKSLSMLHAMANEAWHGQGNMAATLKCCANLIGLANNTADFVNQDNPEISEDADIYVKLNQRLAARTAKNWAESDRIRNELAAQGIILEDKPDGITTWKRG
jgi:cysteinyl-tRNA synthetase